MRDRQTHFPLALNVIKLTKRLSLGAPAIKEVRQFYIKTRMLVELSSKNKLLIAFDFMV
jgi:hypothetical protein